MDFTFRLIQWSCGCGNSPLRVKVGITSFGELLGQWYCPVCKKTCMARIPIEQVIACIPNPPPTFNEGDVRELKDMHIRLD